MFKTQLNGFNFERYILKIAIVTMENGGTASKPATREFLPAMDSWSFPKYPERTAILLPNVDLVEEIKKFIANNESYLRDPDCWLGTWINPYSKQYYLDIAMSCDNLDKARKMDMKVGLNRGRRIVALYNSKRNKTVYL